MESDLIEEELFSFPGGGFGQNILMFGVDMSSSVHIDNKEKTYWFLEHNQYKGQNIH